jgi:glycerol-3-phosphate dehydrogenase (NAD(P)+)
MTRISIIGAGSWGTALAIIASRAGHEVCLWSRNETIVKCIASAHKNPFYLTDQQLPQSITASIDFKTVLTGSRLVVLAAPSHSLRHLLANMSTALEPGSIFVSAAKGIEIETGKRISEVTAEVVGGSVEFVCLSGPSFAKEVVARHPTAIVAASRNQDAALLVQQLFSFENLRVYTNRDVIGTELGGSVKNVMAIAAGMTAGLGFGTNTIAALITRGLAEMTRLALSEGAEFETLMGLAGLGDLVLTCTGGLSRNRFVGEQLGKGKTLEEITSAMNEVAEGIKTTAAVKRRADTRQLEMPITNAVHSVLYEGKTVEAAVRELMSRPLREESK